MVRERRRTDGREESEDNPPMRLNMKGCARLLFLGLSLLTLLVGLALYSASSEDTGTAFYIPLKISATVPSMQIPRPAVARETNMSSVSILVNPGTEQERVYLPANPRQHMPGITDNRKAVKVLIMAYFRSGSTYFSEMFNFNSQVFYMFEPLVYALLPPNKTLALANGKKSTVEKMLKGPYVQKLLDDIFNCRLNTLPIWYLHHPFLTKSQRFSRYLRCIQPIGKRPHHSFRYCLKGLMQMCKASSVRAIKVIRMGITVNTLTKLQSLNPDLKFIHLVRDPRASLLSQFDAISPETGYVAFKRIVGYCDKMEKDIGEIKKLRNSTDIDILSVNYEDMAENPNTAVGAVYSFLGLTLPGRVISGIGQRSSANRHDDKFGTVRENSTQTAYAWKTKIKLDMVKTIDTYCSSWYTQLGYLPVSSRKELLDQNNKHRVPRS